MIYLISKVHDQFAIGFVMNHLVSFSSSIALTLAHKKDRIGLPFLFEEDFEIRYKIATGNKQILVLN